MDKQQFVNRMDELTKQKVPYLFVIDFDFKKPTIFPLKGLPEGILFNVDGVKNYKNSGLNNERIVLEKNLPDFHLYKKAFEYVTMNINKGNSYLVNLTWPTSVNCNFNLKEIFHSSKALFKLYYKEEFIVFSPERFVKIEEGKIYSYPMKGTIDASIPEAEQIILNNKKERAEHATIVDLIRNDLSMVSKNVIVPEFRYISRIQTTHKNLIQVSSKICGKIKKEYSERHGSLFSKILPAGSISGAPKKKTIEIIKNAEPDNRGFYTGVFGVFDGNALDSAVMIRFIENKNGAFVYRSGGGITSQSNCVAEYNELLDKIYVPVY